MKTPKNHGHGRAPETAQNPVNQRERVGWAPGGFTPPGRGDTCRAAETSARAPSGATNRRSSGIRWLAFITFVPAAVLVAERYAQAETYRVGAGQPFKSPDEVAPLLAPGDVMEIYGGATYPGGLVLERSGTASAKITLRGVAVNGKRPVFSGAYNTIEVRADHYVLEGLEITAGEMRCYFHHGDDVTLRDVIIHDCPSQGILGANADAGSLTLQYVEIYRCGSGDKRHPIYMSTDQSAHPGSVFRMEHSYIHDGTGGNNIKSRAERVEILYNWIESAFYRELELISPGGSGGAREDGDVVGNVIINNEGSYAARLGSDTNDSGSRGRYRFVNNTIVIASGSRAAFQMFGQLQSVEAHNNVFYKLGGGSLRVFDDSNAEWVSGSAVFTGSNNWLPSGSEAPSGWTGTLAGSDPGFVSANNYDFHLTPTSPLIDRGTASPQSPAGLAFPSPTFPPAYEPPARRVGSIGSATARGVLGAGIDIGAYEKSAPTSGGGKPADGGTGPSVDGGGIPPTGAGTSAGGTNRSDAGSAGAAAGGTKQDTGRGGSLGQASGNGGSSAQGTQSSGSGGDFGQGSGSGGSFGQGSGSDGTQRPAGGSSNNGSGAGSSGDPHEGQSTGAAGRGGTDGSGSQQADGGAAGGRTADPSREDPELNGGCTVAFGRHSSGHSLAIAGLALIGALLRRAKKNAQASG